MVTSFCHSMVTIFWHTGIPGLWTQKMRSLRSFTCVFWGYLPSTDISCRPHFRHFLPSFLCCYVFSKCKIHSFILVFSDPTLFSLSFPVFYFPYLLLSTFLLCMSFFAYPLLSLSVFLVCLLLSFLLPSTFLLWLSLLTI